MTEFQKKFCELYVIDLDPIKALRDAGSKSLSHSALATTASNMLQVPEVQMYLQELRAQQRAKLGISADRVLLELARLAFVDVRKLYNEDGTMKNIADIDDDTAAAIAQVKSVDIFEGKYSDKRKVGEAKEIKLHDKKGALTDLGRYLGIYDKDNQQSRTLVLNISPETFAQIHKELNSEF